MKIIQGKIEHINLAIEQANKLEHLASIGWISSRLIECSIRLTQEESYKLNTCVREIIKARMDALAPTINQLEKIESLCFPEENQP